MTLPRHHDFGIDVHKFNPKLIGDWTMWSEYYLTFHKGPPWNEYLWCATCASSASDQFGPVGTIGIVKAEELKLNSGDPCPKCGSQLELFWSPRRTKQYVNEALSMQGFNGVVGFVSGKLLYWLWGFIKTPKELSQLLNGEPTFYVDVIAAEPSARREYLYEAAIYFIHWLQEVIDNSYVTRIALRTHKDALNVIVLAHLLGFKPTGIGSEDDPDRMFWVRGITKEEQEKAFADVDKFPRFASAVQRRKPPS